MQSGWLQFGSRPLAELTHSLAIVAKAPIAPPILPPQPVILRPEMHIRQRRNVCARIYWIPWLRPVAWTCSHRHESAPPRVTHEWRQMRTSDRHRLSDAVGMFPPLTD